MTNDEAIKTLRKDYCGEKFFCELHQDGLCNTEDCEIWWAITALENAKNDNLTTESAQNVPNQAFKMQKSDVLGVKTGETCSDTISRQAAIDAVTTHGTELERRGITVLSVSNYKQVTVDLLESLPSAQPEITPDGTLKVTVDADIANVGRILLSQAGTQYGGLYYKDEQPEPTLEQIEKYCHKRCLSIVDNALLHKYAQAEIHPEIIHCKDCKYCDKGIDEDDNPFLKCLGRVYGGTQEEYFCSHAERRTDGVDC